MNKYQAIVYTELAINPLVLILFDYNFKVFLIEKKTREIE